MPVPQIGKCLCIPGRTCAQISSGVTIIFGILIFLRYTVAYVGEVGKLRFSPCNEEIADKVHLTTLRMNHGVFVAIVGALLYISVTRGQHAYMIPWLALVGLDIGFIFLYAILMFPFGIGIHGELEQQFWTSVVMIGFDFSLAFTWVVVYNSFKEMKDAAKNQDQPLDKYTKY